MRGLAFALLLLAARPALAWEFTPSIPCLLRYDGPEVSVELTYDPGAPLYSISITQAVPFAPAPVFSLGFEGPAPLRIGTDRHQLSDGGRTLTVTDRGFGNVLNGMQFNRRAVAVLGAQMLTIPLEGVAEPLAAFRRCNALPLS